MDAIGLNDVVNPMHKRGPLPNRFFGGIYFSSVDSASKWSPANAPNAVAQILTSIPREVMLCV
jgi:hypothetical protein